MLESLSYVLLVLEILGFKWRSELKSVLYMKEFLIQVPNPLRYVMWVSQAK